MTIKGSLSKHKNKIVSDAPKLELQKWENLNKHFHESNLAAPKIFSIFIFRPLPFYSH